MVELIRVNLSLSLSKMIWALALAMMLLKSLPKNNLIGQTLLEVNLKVQAYLSISLSLKCTMLLRPHKLVKRAKLACVPVVTSL